MMMEIKSVINTQEEIKDTLKNHSNYNNEDDEADDEEILQSTTLQQFEKVEDELKRSSKRKTTVKLRVH